MAAAASQSDAMTGGTEAAERFSPEVAATSQDVGDVVHLEHINLEVPDLDLARVFYCEGLGMTPDPDTLGWQRGGPFVTWFNIGRQQFHICRGPVPQNTLGTIVLKLPSLARAAERLNKLGAVLQGTQFAVSVDRSQQCSQQQGPDHDQQSGSGSGASRDASGAAVGSIGVTDPWGQQFLLVQEAQGFPFAAGIVELRLPCFPGTSHQIARFYSEVLGARVAEHVAEIDTSSSSSSGIDSPGSRGARVFLGPGSCLHFLEDTSLGEHTQQAVEQLWTGWHVAFYIARFSGAFERSLALNINLLDHPYRDKSPDVAAALSNRQFRFKDVVHLDAFGKRGELLYCLGHEVRSLHHPSYLRPLYNRRE